jgi:transcriptional regulator with XRE-family HTH domain
LVWVRRKEYVAAGQVLAQARHDAGLTQKDLAARLRKPQSFVSGYENGQRRIDVIELAIIAEVLAADPVKIFAEIVKARARTR